MPTKFITTGSECFRMKLVLSLLTNQPIRILNIRDRSNTPGVVDAEVNFLNLINDLSNGSAIHINDTGCIVNFSPGTLVGGELTFDCCTDRGIGYFLEPLLILSTFMKSPLSILLTGVTNNNIDPSVDLIANTWLPLLKKFIPPASGSCLKLEIRKRGLAPMGGGIVHLESKPAEKISPVSFTSPGKVYRIRGVAWTCRVSPGNATQMIQGAKKLLNSFISDVYINLDQRKRDSVGQNAGFGLIIWAETKAGAFYSAEATSEQQGASNSQPVVPSELGYKAASRLLDQIRLRACTDQSYQSLALTMMALEGGRNANQLLISSPTPYTVSTLRLLRDFLGITFDLAYEKISDSTHDECMDEELPSPLIATCFGSGVKNINLSIR